MVTRTNARYAEALAQRLVKSQPSGQKTQRQNLQSETRKPYCSSQLLRPKKKKKFLIKIKQTKKRFKPR